MLNKIMTYKYGVALGFCLALASCSPTITALDENKAAMPESFDKSTDTTNISTTKWRTYFKDANLVSLIDSALKNNQELEMTLQEIEIARNDVRVKKGLLLPMVTASVGAGVDKVGRYTSTGAGDASTEITPGKEVPEALQDYGLGLHAVWEVDIWKKLRNAKKSSIHKVFGYY